MAPQQLQREMEFAFEFGEGIQHVVSKGEGISKIPDTL